MKNRPVHLDLGHVQAGDAVERRARRKAAGVPFKRYDGMGLEQDQDDVWTAPNGDLVAWFTDLDGHVLSLTRFTTPAP